MEEEDRTLIGFIGANKRAVQQARVELFVGKGGTGKSTLAAATAIALAREGENVLLASIDQAHSAADILGVTIAHQAGVSSAPQAVQGGLEVIEIDTLALLEERYRELSSMAAKAGAHEHVGDFPLLDAGEVTGMPGVQELLGLMEVANLASDDEWDVVVVDCPPTAELARTLAAPDMVLGYLERLWPKPKRLAAAVSTDVRRAVAVAAVEKVVSGVDDVRAMLTDRERVRARIVATASRVAINETARLRSALALVGVRVDDVIINRVLAPLDSGDAGNSAQHWYSNRRNEQLDAISGFSAAMPTARIAVATDAGAEPIGLTSLNALSYAIRSEVGASDDDPDANPAVTIAEDGDDHLVRVHLPAADAGTLQLGRVGDDLIIAVDGFRRRIALASQVRNSQVVSAELADDLLVLRFSPNES